MSTRIIVAGGGTGGHIFCALAIAQALREARSSTEILFVGPGDGVGLDAVRAAGLRVATLWISGIARTASLASLARNLALPAKLLASSLKARSILADFPAEVAVGVGGYASGPVLREAQRRGIPTAIHEANAVPGLTNRWLAPRAARICLGLAAAKPFFDPGVALVTGNPVRPDLRAGPGAAPRSLFGLEAGRRTMLVTGGSLGSTTLNRFVLESREALDREGVQILWQCGPAHAEECRARLPGGGGGGSVRLLPFIEDMASAYAAADLVISGAGALSIAEVAALGKPAVFVPLPEASDDHQTANARAVLDGGVAPWVPAAEAGERLLGLALDLLRDERRRASLSESLARIATSRAAERIAAQVLALAGNGNGNGSEDGGGLVGR